MTTQTMVNEAAKTVWSYIDLSGRWGLTTDQQHLHNASDIKVASLEEFEDYGCVTADLDCGTSMYDNRFILADGTYQGFNITVRNLDDGFEDYDFGLWLVH